MEFYHGYYQDASEWAPAQVMRDIYDEFAKEHADGEVEFKAIPTEDIDSVVENKVAGGSYPDMVDLAGRSVSLAAISQDLLLEMKKGSKTTLESTIHRTTWMERFIRFTISF